MMAKEVKQDLDGKQLVAIGRKPDEPEISVLRLTHSDPSRRASDHIDIHRGAVLRVPQDISEVDGRFLLDGQSEYQFRIEDQPSEKQSEAPKGDK